MTAQYGIRYKCSMQKTTSPGLLPNDTVRWEWFTKSVWWQIRRMICLNFPIRNCSEITKKNLFRNEKNNLKTITTPCFHPLILKSYRTCSNSSTQTNPRSKRKSKTNRWIRRKRRKTKSTNKTSSKKSLTKLPNKPNKNWLILTILTTRLTTRLAKDTIRSFKKWSWTLRAK